MTAPSFGEQLARAAFSEEPAEDALRRALGVLEEALGTPEVFLLYALGDSFEPFSRGATMDLTPKGLWVVNRELTSRRRSVGFRRTGNRVEGFGGTRGRTIEFVATLVPSRHSSAQMLIARGPWARGLTAKQSRVIESCVPALSLIVSRWLKHSQAERERAELSVLANVSQLVAQSSDLEATLTAFAEIVGNVAELDYVTIDAIGADGRVAFRCINYEVPEGWRDRWRVGKDNPDPVRDFVLKTRQPLVFPDAQNDPRIPEAGRKYFERSLIRSTAVVPLVANDEAVGLLSLATNHPTEFGGKQRELIDALAQQVATAIRGIRLYDELRISREQLTEREARFRSLVENASDLITVIDADTTVLYQGPSITRVLGHAPETINGGRFIDLVHPDDGSALAALLGDAMRGGSDLLRADVRLRDAENRWHECEIIATDRRSDASINGFVLNVRDVSERRALEEELRRQALHDALTGLANRTCFLDRLTMSLTRTQRSGGSVAVLFIDLDNFKSVNDGLGHAAGDDVLQAMASRLQECLRAGDTAARFGGDEFAILVDDLPSDGDQSEAEGVARRILASMRRPFFVEGREVYLGASIGLASASRGVSAEELLQQADAAMYAAKSRGKSRIERFAAGLQEAVVQRLELLADLQRAVERDELVLHYQPMVDLQSNETVGLEALARWQHPTRGLIAPDDFIPLAEESGLIVEIGRWVLREACQQVAAWDAAYPERRLTLSVNVSPRQLQDDDFASDVAAALRDTGFDAERLVLEITETVMMQDSALAKAVFDEVCALACGSQ
jgi:diguanylate cyclase (GGDEF)-like protein/PAS domain S-box-containing protein